MNGAPLTPEERAEELLNALGSLYRVRIATRYEDLGREGVAEIVLAECLVVRARRRAQGEKIGTLPKQLRDLRAELET